MGHQCGQTILFSFDSENTGVNVRPEVNLNYGIRRITSGYNVQNIQDDCAYASIKQIQDNLSS
jgi:hypothetical protein